MISLHRSVVVYFLDQETLRVFDGRFDSIGMCDRFFHEPLRESPLPHSFQRMSRELYLHNSIVSRSINATLFIYPAGRYAEKEVETLVYNEWHAGRGKKIRG